MESSAVTPDTTMLFQKYSAKGLSVHISLYAWSVNCTGIQRTGRLSASASLLSEVESMKTKGKTANTVDRPRSAYETMASTRRSRRSDDSAGRVIALSPP